ncbi:unnamed protein product [Clavelina lepadiformis]|uniref:Major facilitator superfamily (MFS) profile domain-containing protein n=1 Tax=Clavelina lepadiformis TaxID=159417 RepID=A0ABP0GM21_CLALP
MNFKDIFNGKDFGYYEKRLCFLLFLSTIPNIFPPLQVLVNSYTPPHRCDVNIPTDKSSFQSSDGETLASKHWQEVVFNLTIPFEKQSSDGTYKKSACKQYNISTESMRKWISGDGTTSDLLDLRTNESGTIPCSKYLYEGKEVSVITEFDLVCDKSRLKPLFTSLFMVGMLAGGPIGGFLSDKFGRRVAFLAFTLWQFVVAFVTSFATSPAFYGVMQFLAGISALVNYASAVMIGSEFVHPDLRSFTYYVLGSGYAIGYILLAPVMYLIRDWRWFMRFSAFVGIPYISYYWLIDETPVWLAAKGKDKQLIMVLDKIAKINKQERKSLEEVKEKLMSEESTLKTSRHPLLDVAKSFTLVWRLIIMGFSWFVVSLTYYVLALNNNNLNGNRFLNVFYAGLAELASVLAFYLLVESRGRRSSYMIIMGCCGLGIAVNPLVARLSASLVVVITMFNKFATGAAYAIVYSYVGEMFPTATRQSMLGVCSCCARVGGIISPYIIHEGENGDILAPSIAMAVVILLSVVLYLFLPETKNKRLPQTTGDASEMKGLVYFACCKSKKTQNAKCAEI